MGRKADLSLISIAYYQNRAVSETNNGVGACGEDRGQREIREGFLAAPQVRSVLGHNYFLGRRARSSHGGRWRASERVSSCCVDRSSP